MREGSEAAASPAPVHSHEVTLGSPHRLAYRGMERRSRHRKSVSLVPKSAAGGVAPAMTRSRTMKTLPSALSALRGMAAILLCTLCATLVHAQGTVLAVGSAVRDDNNAVWERLADLAGGPGSRVAIFTAPSSEPDAAAFAISESLARRGLMGVHIRVGPGVAGQDVEAAARDPEWVAKVLSAQAVFFSGGNQARLIDTLRPGGRTSPLLEAVQAVYRRGGVIAGESAGAAVMSEEVWRDPPQDPLLPMKMALRPGVDIDRGFGFLRDDAIIDQHLIRRGRIGRLLRLMQLKGKPLGIGVEEHTAVVVRGDEVEVVGHRGVLIVDLAPAKRDAALGDLLNLRGARLWLLDHGDRFDLAKRQLQPSLSRRAAQRLDIGNPEQAGRVASESWGSNVYGDMLAENMFVFALTRLAEQGPRSITGLSFSARPGRDDALPDLGFEWTLRTRPGSVAWRERPDRYTVGDVELDIVPIQMQRPLYIPYRR